MRSTRTHVGIILALLLSFAIAPPFAAAGPFFPPLEKLKADRPRLLLRPSATPLAVSLEQLKAIPRDAEFNEILGLLRKQNNAAAQAMVYLLTGETAAADKAVARMKEWKGTGADAFDVYFGFREMALAYDWLHGYPGFTKEAKADLRRRADSLAETGLKIGNDHVFHNYVWMSNGGLALWALATAGEDEKADALARTALDRLETRQFPAAEYLAGQPGEPLGYWELYCYSPGVLALLAAQSAFETDLVGKIAKDQGDWFARQLDGLILGTLPNMRFVPFGDMQSGPDGGVTHEMAALIDASAWALRSQAGVYFSRWLAGKRRLARFYGFQAVLYPIWSRNLSAKPAEPPLAMLAGDRNGGHLLARSGWGDGDTVVAFRCTDHLGGHSHFDQGSFVIYRNGLLALDAGVYKHPGGAPQKTEPHNTLLIAGQEQRYCRGQWFKTLEEFKANLTGGKRLETGDILFYKDTPAWAAVAGQFAQAYATGVVESCVRQLLFVRPGTVVVVDQLAAPEGKTLGDVQWLLHTPAEPKVDGAALAVSNGTSWLHCRSMVPDAAAPTIKPSLPTLTDRSKSAPTFQATYAYPGGGRRLTLVHVLQVGDGTAPAALVSPVCTTGPQGVEVRLGERTFTFAGQGDFAVQGRAGE